MNKPTFKKLCLMYMQQLTNFPYIEKDFDALTDYGLLCKVVDYLNEVIKNNNIQNESITNLYNAFIELKEYVDNLDLQDEVNNKLDEMANDGSLINLLNNKIYHYASIQTHRVGRFILDNGLNNKQYEDIPYYAAQQSMCLIDDNTAVLCFSASNGNYKYNDKILIKKVNLTNGYIISSNIIDAGHGNGICYDGDFLYVTECFTRNNTTSYTYTNKVYKVNVDSLNIIDTIEIDGLDLTNNILLNMEYYNGKFYAMQRGKVHELDENFTVVNTINLNLSSIVAIGTYQTIHLYNNYIYMINAYPNAIYMFDMFGNNIQNYAIDDYIENAFYIGEFEDISFDSKGNIIGVSNDVPCEGCDFNITQIFKFNLIKNQSIKDVDPYTPNFRKRLTVSNTVTWAPDGTSASPFNELAEAIEFSLSPKGKNVHYINLVNGTYKWCFICGVSNKLRISGNNSTVNGLSIFYSSILLQNLNLITYSNNELGLVPLFMDYSDVELENVSFIKDNIDYNTFIDMYYSKLKLFNSTPTELLDTQTFINANQMCEIKYRGEIKNIKTTGNYLDYGNYPITDDLNLNTTGSISRNSYMIENDIYFNDKIYVNKYIYFVLSTINGQQVLKKFKAQNTDTQTFNIAFTETSSDNFWISQMNVKLENNTLNITANRTIKMNGTSEATPHLTLKKIYVSQY